MRNHHHTYFFTFVFLVLCFSLLTAADSQRSGKGEQSLFKKFPFPTQDELLKALDQSQTELSFLQNKANTQQKLSKLARYFKEKAAERYYFDWRNFKDRLKQYLQIFPDARKKHLKIAAEHMEKFPAQATWQRPMTDLKGKPVTAYEYRHLARQSKIMDLAFSYYIKNEDAHYLNYFVQQVKSLQRAFEDGKVETGGNAAYEVFRAGKRVHHWLFNHHAFLASNSYDWQAQLLLIQTFLHHGRILAAGVEKFRPGNHHTRGLVGLFEIAACFPEFKESAQWRKLALDGLMWHMKNEINDDGFQFERSGHYHKGDIENYLRVYQLAMKNGIELPEGYVEKFRSMFQSLVQLAMPNKALPVLQDDTDGGSMIEADISEPLAVGAMIFKDPLFRYFSNDHPPESYYWLLSSEQIEQLNKLSRKAPDFGSLALKETGYYVMRDGWQEDARYLLISAGLEKRKPDHQHGDMLGIIAYAGGSTFLPNYKVRYNREDFFYLKNSWAKNVALVDSHLQGRGWKSNRGGSGFGKWKFLPEPKVNCWHVSDVLDYFSGQHNGFENLGVAYQREVVFVKNGFWIVFDHFRSNSSHTYQQVWQGPFEIVNSRLIKQPLKNGQLVYLWQHGADHFKIKQHKFGMDNRYQNNVFETEPKQQFTFTTLILPGGRINEEKELVKLREFTIRDAENYSVNSNLIFKPTLIVEKQGHPLLLSGVTAMSVKGKPIQFKQPLHFLVINIDDGKLTCRVYGNDLGHLQKITKNRGEKLQCGSIVELTL